MNKKKIYVLLIIAVLGLVVFLFSREKEVAVKRIDIKPRAVQRTVSASGEVKPTKKADLSFGVSGRVRDIYVSKGQKVFSGQPLAVLENSSDYQTAQSLKDALDIAKRDYEYFVLKKEDNLDLYGSSGYELKLRVMQENISKAEAAYKSQLALMEKSYIYAPFAGTVLDILAEEKETLPMGSTLIKMADLENTYFEINLDQEDFGKVSINQEVSVTLDAFPNRTFPAYISKLPLFVNTSSGNEFTVEVSFFEKESKILPGMLGDAYIILEKTPSEVPSITFDEIYYDIDNKPYLYVFSDGLIKEEHVDLGVEGDVFIELKSDLKGIPVKPVSDKVTLSVNQKAKLID